jgi:hypothetical protein
MHELGTLITSLVKMFQILMKVSFVGEKFAVALKLVDELVDEFVETGSVETGSGLIYIVTVQVAVVEIADYLYLLEIILVDEIQKLEEIQKHF